MTVWREEDLAAAHAGQKRLDRRDLIDGGFDHDEYAANRRMAEEAKRFYDLVGEQAVQALMDKGYTAKDFCTAATAGNGGATYKHTSAEEIKQLLADLKPAVNVGRAYLVVPPDVMQLDMDFTSFENEQTTSRVWRHHWGDYKFGIPIIRTPILHMGVDWARPPVEEEPVLPRLMAEHVEPEKPKDLTFWQALIFVVGAGTILCLLGGAL